MSALSFANDDPRVRVLNDAPLNKRGEFVLYFCQMFRRGEDNAALAFAIERANALGLPCVVYEAIRPDYPYASDRFHTFLLEGAKDNAARLARRGIKHVFFLPKTRDEARGVLAKLSARAALVVSDDFPSFITPAQNAAGAKHVKCTYIVVDDNAVVPLGVFGKQEYAARTIRPKLWRAMDAWLLPLQEPEPRASAPERIDLPFDALDLAKADVAACVAACRIDHTVPPCPEFPGGQTAADARLDAFLRKKLRGYTTDRNEPSRDATSHLSPYLHFGMISARRVAIAAREYGEAAEPFLEQVIVRRGLAFNFARYNPNHRTYGVMPDWARETLAVHKLDKREALLTLEQLTDARSPDALWNAAQLELRVRGVIHNYLRMLWGKLAMTWIADPREAHETLVHLNDRFALDGRDPDGYTNIGWCFGLHDRPWPERAIFGKVRSMTSRSAQSKLDCEGYLSQARSWRHEL